MKVPVNLGYGIRGTAHLPVNLPVNFPGFGGWYPYPNVFTHGFLPVDFFRVGHSLGLNPEILPGRFVGLDLGVDLGVLIFTKINRASESAQLIRTLDCG